MAFLPEFTQLGQLELIEVYEYYDQPVLFSCQNPSGHIFLAVWADEEDDFDTWLYVRMSPLRFEHVRSGLIDLHDAFARSEDGLVFEVQIPHDEQELSIRHIWSHAISEDWLPGEFLDLETEPLPILNDIPRKAGQSNGKLLPLEEVFSKDHEILGTLVPVG